ncbi:tRNA synthetases class II-domain-containing protein [Lineolata rhizophorae]|uniref:tRNA synthetases class II-domain-containing protein n=1 Tax=Lineolata rhizophorae TaxID=578093 RepID=A0A6A6NSB2_9PEZI|nr:tRNA synthetases class II-domain-containing protein [Lineolata rhizophorae]
MWRPLRRRPTGRARHPQPSSTRSLRLVMLRHAPARTATTQLTSLRVSYCEISRLVRRRCPLANATLRGYSTDQSPDGTAPAQSPSANPPGSAILEAYKHTFKAHGTSCQFDHLEWAAEGDRLSLVGYVGTIKEIGKALAFVPLSDKNLARTIQIVSCPDDPMATSHVTLKSLRSHTPVLISGFVQKRKQKPRKRSSESGGYNLYDHVEIKLHDVQPLNNIPDDIIFGTEKIFPPEQRYLQIRTDNDIRNALKFRSNAAQCTRNYLSGDKQFVEVETPLLFKSTPEGAREFLVPTRTKGLAYALPQSPQQYKQILMAGGIGNYFQIARCFRDEDLRADRQPEFTQIDLEMSFAAGRDVMNTVEALVKQMWRELLGINIPGSFRELTYEEAMSKYGSDKPDLRFGMEIARIDYMLPIDLVTKIGPLLDPIVEAIKIPNEHRDAKEARTFINAFIDSPDARPFVSNPDGQPGIFIYDPRKPLSGLQPLGFEAAEQLEEMWELDEGDIVVIQARRNKSFSGGSTTLGSLRSALHRAAVEHGLVPKISKDDFKFLWITQFPLFSPNEEDAPGQGGTAGFSATHHPFTAPLAEEDVTLLAKDPLRVRADHYDLVVNGVELGGGSRRIHHANAQEYIFRHVLKMSEERIADFTHLLDALRAGCPPHAGFALGFDRLVAVMLGKSSVRDVIAFPKNNKGEEPCVKSPTIMTMSQLDTYHLALKE